MEISVKDINIKTQTCYFFNDITYIESSDPNNITIDEKSHKNIIIYSTGYATIKNDLKIYSVNPLYIYSVKWMDTFKKLIKISI